MFTIALPEGNLALPFWLFITCLCSFVGLIFLLLKKRHQILNYWRYGLPFLLLFGVFQLALYEIRNYVYVFLHQYAGRAVYTPLSVPELEERIEETTTISDYLPDVLLAVQLLVLLLVLFKIISLLFVERPRKWAA